MESSMWEMALVLARLLLTLLQVIIVTYQIHGYWQATRGGQLKKDGSAWEKQIELGQLVFTVRLRRKSGV